MAKQDWKSGAPFDPELFKPEAVSPEMIVLNESITKTFDPLDNWWEVGAQRVRDARARGEGPYPKPSTSKVARTLVVEGSGYRKVPIRVIAPENPRGVYLHIHGGGWVLGGADLQDPALERTAKNTGLVCVSVEYRLAPEHPYPAGPDDCEAVAGWLSKNAKAEFGTELLTIGGESAGAHLAALTLLRMRDRHGFTGFKAANLVYGVFDLSMTPSQRSFGNRRLVLRTIDIVKFADAFLTNVNDRRDPDVSPLYADLKGLPPALFTIGTSDALLDDSLFMYARWIAAGNQADLAVYPGGAHAFTLFPCALTESALTRAEAFLAQATLERTRLETPVAAS